MIRSRRLEEIMNAEGLSDEEVIYNVHLRIDYGNVFFF